jgi:hypothetical protein
MTEIKQFIVTKIIEKCYLTLLTFRLYFSAAEKYIFLNIQYRPITNLIFKIILFAVQYSMLLFLPFVLFQELLVGV